MFSDYMDQEVVVDTLSSFVYIGKLSLENDLWIELINVDVHDVNDSASNKEIYIRKSRETGVKYNRSKCRIDKNKIISISLLTDIELFE